MGRVVLLTLLFATCSSCAIGLAVPMNRFQTPEVAHGNVHLAIGTKSRAELTPDLATEAPQTIDPELSAESVPFMGGLSVDSGIPGLEVGAATDLASMPLEFRAKYQFFGGTREQHQEGFSAAITARAGINYDSGDSTEFLGTKFGEYSQHITDGELGFLVGYRTGAVIFYGGPFFHRASFSGTWSQFDRQGGSKIDSRGYSGSFRQNGGAVGLSWDIGTAALMFEFVRFKASLGASSNWDSGVGLVLAIFW